MNRWPKPLPLVVVIATIALASCRDQQKVGDNQPSVTNADLLEQFDIARGGEPILLPVQLAGETHLFFLDTGAEATVFDTRLRPHLTQLKESTKFLTPDGIARGELFEAPNASVGKLKLRTGGPVICMDLSLIRHVTGREVYGFLGMDFLQKYAIEVDFDRGKLLFLKTVDVSKPTRGHPNRMTYAFIRTPHILVDLPGETPQPFVVDTGTTLAGTLETNLFERLVAERRIQELYSGQSVTLAGARARKRGLLSSLSTEAGAVRGLVFGTSSSNNLGLGFWSRYVVTFDFPNKIVYLRKGERFGHPDRYDLSGLHILRIDGNTIVHSVDEGTPAAKAGIKETDRIAKIGERTAEGYSMHRIRQLLSVEGERIDITIQRGEAEFGVSFQLPEAQMSRVR